MNPPKLESKLLLLFLFVLWCLLQWWLLVILGGEMYVYAFVLDSWKVNNINGILNGFSLCGS